MYRDYASLEVALATVFLAVLLNFLAKLYRARITIARFRNLGLVRIPGNVFTGKMPTY